MEVVGESILFAALEVLFGKLACPDLLKFARQEEVIAELEGWKRELRMINEVLDEAEEKQVTKLSVKEWVDDLRDLAYDMEDVLDEFATELLRRRLIADRANQVATTSKVRSLIPTCFTGFNPVGEVKFNIEMGSKIKAITGRLDDISNRKDMLGFNMVPGVEKSGKRFASGAAPTWQRPPTTSLINEPVHGRDEDKKVIIDMLLNDEAGESNFGVIPIVGMGGMGKTTLAQFIYRDDEIVKQFGPRVWVCVSDESDVEKLTKIILNAVSPDEIRDGDDFNQVQLKLSKSLAGKRFLLVLDDVWNIKRYEQWNQLRAPFKSGKEGSKIVVTTRDTNVASLMRADNYHHFLRPLSHDDCWSVFVEHAFESKNVDEYPNLKSIGEKIVQKCSGLPLAAKMVGGLLRSKLQVEAWKRVLDSNIWDSSECGIVPILRLSYQHLSPHLKRCFAYCALFPKDYEFEEKQLILLWMAEGLIHQAKGDNWQIEDSGTDYFNELLSRCFFQPSNNRKLRFVMHDLINDLAQDVAAEICFTLENVDKISKSTRHLSFMCSKYDVFKKFEVCEQMEQLRTFFALPINIDNEKQCYLSAKVFHYLLPKLRHLRVLSLSCYEINELPDSIGDLKHLRYLNLSHTALKRLPETISNLYNLQSLILCNCRELMKLPVDIVNLINLRHLDISGSTLLEEMPPQISKLINLQTLSKFILSEGNGSQIIELKNLLNLRGELAIFGLDNIVDKIDVRYVNLKERPSIEEIMMVWSKDFGNSRNESDEKEVLKLLEPHESLKKLTIAFYGGTIFPRWIGDSSFSKMVILRLKGCKKCTSLPALGRLSSLKILEIEGMNEIKSIGNEFYGEIVNPFRCLEYLAFEDMPEWTDCNLPDCLACLVKLEVEECQELTISIPRFPFLAHLIVDRCNEGMLKSRVVDVPSLTKLYIEEISKPSCLWEGLVQPLTTLQDQGIIQLSLEEQGLPCNLQYLEKLPNALHTLTSLTDMLIRNCPKLVSFPETGLPPMLRNLSVENCEGLEILPDGMMINSRALEFFKITYCSSLIGFPRGELPTTLKTLIIHYCGKLESLPDGIMHHTCCLERLQVWGCSSLKSIPRGDFPSTLEGLSIWGCNQLESIPGKMLQNLTSLRNLFLCNCPDVMSSSLEVFSTSNLKTLTIANGKKQCEEASICPEPPHTHSIASIGLQTLISLKVLQFTDCPKLRSFVPKKGLPSTLERLVIKGCPILKKRCLKDKGKDWPKIAHIPYVEIDDIVQQ
ncbi:putative disease resistance RPP13-like protein 1 [Vitis vinifera]|uniref:Putative disease resistance RPP13-like protein 1 n=1 Tax=Vitis vinifera TaxID=29760 RepID=A0A438HW51_VITVI|nr:putative disease resistance RPP13-like protein 1 [Vitis vinifera]